MIQGEMFMPWSPALPTGAALAVFGHEDGMCVGVHPCAGRCKGDLLFLSKTLTPLSLQITSLVPRKKVKSEAAPKSAGPGLCLCHSGGLCLRNWGPCRQSSTSNTPRSCLPACLPREVQREESAGSSAAKLLSLVLLPFETETNFIASVDSVLTDPSVKKQSRPMLLAGDDVVPRSGSLFPGSVGQPATVPKRPLYKTAACLTMNGKGGYSHLHL